MKASVKSVFIKNVVSRRTKPHGSRSGTECAKKPLGLKAQPGPRWLRLSNELLPPSRRNRDRFLSGLPSRLMPPMQSAVHTRCDSCLFGCMRSIGSPTPRSGRSLQQRVCRIVPDGLAGCSRRRALRLVSVLRQDRLGDATKRSLLQPEPIRWSGGGCLQALPRF
jgi:hypothetical protein